MAEGRRFHMHPDSGAVGYDHDDAAARRQHAPEFAQNAFGRRRMLQREIGRATCRESVCQYVLLSVVAAPSKKKPIVYVTFPFIKDSQQVKHVPLCTKITTVY